MFENDYILDSTTKLSIPRFYFLKVAKTQSFPMDNFTPTINRSLNMGKGQPQPFFNVLTNQKSRKSPIWSLTTDKVYEKMTVPPYKIPRMHSYWVPTYLKLMKQRERAQIDDGFRLYNKFPIQRFCYRGMWLYTSAALFYTVWKVGFYLYDNRP